MTSSPQSENSPTDPEHASFAARLKQKYGDGVDPEVSLDRPAADAPSGASSELLRRLADHSLKQSRYKLQGEIARGGMGAILKVWDEDLRRTLAMKVILGRADSQIEGGTPPVDTRTLGRFLEEAQVTGQLDHPGIVPVHELGLDSDGRVYFTMRLVKGEDLRAIYDHVETGHDGWNETRALGVLLKLCDAMSYAHDKGVVHRDLKPANVMVGKYGEVYVMDWGLARVIGQQDRHDIRPRPEAQTSAPVRTERRSERDATPDSPLVTMDGDVVGTPAYMSPEQARGEVEKLGPRSDVYAVGAMLYHLLARQMPFVPRNVRASAHTVLMRVLEGPPRPLLELAPRASAELVAICEKAMARDAMHRYPDMRALAEDLRAYLERRVVRAYEMGTWAETRKWVQRNKPLAASLAAAMAILVCGVLFSTKYATDAKLATKRAEDKTEEALAEARRADENTLEATRLKDAALARERDLRIRSLVQDLAAFESLDDSLDYARKQSRPANEWWITRARRLVDGHKGYFEPVVSQFDKIARVLDGDGSFSTRDLEWSPGLTDVEALLDRMRTPALVHGSIEAGLDYAHDQDKWWYDRLTQLSADLHRLKRSVEQAEESVASPAAVALWSEAIEAISTSPQYAGLRITPQLGLLPIGPDPASGLWEFAHLQTGTAPTRGTDGKLTRSDETGLVFVLLPGRHAPADALPDSAQRRPWELVELDAFFISKYEMTEAQWNRLGGWRRAGHQPTNLSLPMWEANWDDCTRTLSRATSWVWLPTEAQWEYAARAGTSTPWWTGEDASSLQDSENIDFDPNDRSSPRLRVVGDLRPNAFGLHDCLGNVREWCRDAFAKEPTELRPGDGLFDQPEPEGRVMRGGSQYGGADQARATARMGWVPDSRNDDSGLRPARGVTP